MKNVVSLVLRKAAQALRLIWVIPPLQTIHALRNILYVLDCDEVVPGSGCGILHTEAYLHVIARSSMIRTRKFISCHCSSICKCYIELYMANFLQCKGFPEAHSTWWNASSDMSSGLMIASATYHELCLRCFQCGNISWGPVLLCILLSNLLDNGRGHSMSEQCLLHRHTALTSGIHQRSKSVSKSSCKGFTSDLSIQHLYSLLLMRELSCK